MGNLHYGDAMGRWITITAVILLLVAGGYWFLQRKGIENCQAVGGSWNYERWACDT